MNNKFKILLPTLLLAGVLGVQVVNGKPIVQVEVESKTIADTEAFQTNELNTKGKYTHIPETTIEGELPTTYRVDEFLYPDGTRGYQTIITTLEDVLVFNATTSQNELVKVKRYKSVGYGKEAQMRTYEK